MVMNWSAHQTAIFDEVRTRTSSIVIQAVAGSGKSTTLVEIFSQLPNTSRALFLAFNKAIVVSLDKKLGGRAQCKTFHSLCMGALMRALNIRNVKRWVSDRKTWDLVNEYEILMCRQHGDDIGKMMIKVLGGPAKKLLSLAKQVGIGIDGLAEDSPEEWINIWEHHALDFDYRIVNACGALYRPSVEDLVTMCRWLLRRSVENVACVVDFDDMIYMALHLGVKFPQFDAIGVDEAQDTNPVRRKVISLCLAKGGRVIAVGDRGQAIYGFTGADASAMELIRDQFGAIELPLSVTYRCPVAVVEKAKEIVPQIEAAHGAIEGSVIEDTLTSSSDLGAIFKGGDAVLCRNTRPLVKLAYMLIRAGIGARIAGRDIGQGLIAMIDKFNRKTLADLRVRAEDFRVKEIERLINKGDKASAGAVDDKVGSLLVLIDMMPDGSSIDDLRAQIDRMFSDGSEAGQVVLSTVHKAKGLEWSKVFILKPELFPSRWALKPWQLVQENNLLYVAYTRAMRELVLLSWYGDKEGGDA
jgi:DNA helicase-2/ATP-dependent DNA helicase PcrA